MRHRTIAIMAPEGYRESDAFDCWASTPNMRSFLEPIRSRGYLICNSLSEQATSITPAGVIDFNHDRGSRHWAEFPRERRVLVMWEPPSTQPAMFRTRTLRRYGFVYSPSHVWPKERDCRLRYFPWPQDTASPHASGTWDQRRPRAVLVASNKWSFYPGNLYWLRRWAAQHPVVDTYGALWNSGLATARHIAAAARTCVNAGQAPHLREGLRAPWMLPRAHFGACEEKLPVMRQYKFALVIENSPDYVSEKLGDAFAAGCHPIYVGADLRQNSIPTHEVVAAPANIRGLDAALREATADGSLLASGPRHGLSQCPHLDRTRVMEKLARGIMRDLNL